MKNFCRSGLEPEDMQVIYNYVTNTLIPAHLEKELEGGSVIRNSSSPFTSSHYGKWVLIHVFFLIIEQIINMSDEKNKLSSWWTSNNSANR